VVGIGGGKNTTHFQAEFLTTRFFATQFFQMPADVVGIGGGKKHHAFPDGAFSNARADVVGIGGGKTPRIVRYQAICPPSGAGHMPRPRLARVPVVNAERPASVEQPLDEQQWRQRRNRPL
jgi:hypothetical protein